MKEKIIVPAIYTSISQNNCKTVTAYVNDKEMTYFDYENGKQLLPAKLTQAVPFDTEFEGFAECTIGDNNWGYLPRDMEPVININDVKLFTKDEVCALVMHEKKLALIINANNKYVDMTNKSYDKRKKYND